MDTFECAIRAQLARKEGQKLKVFDWDKAACIIKTFLMALQKRGTLLCVYAGLRADAGNTTDVIFEDGKVVTEDRLCYLASIWDTPVLTLYITDDTGNESEKEIECWRYKDEVPQWDSNTLWPESALKILND